MQRSSEITFYSHALFFNPNNMLKLMIVGILAISLLQIVRAVIQVRCLEPSPNTEGRGAIFPAQYVNSCSTSSEFTTYPRGKNGVNDAGKAATQ